MWLARTQGFEPWDVLPPTVFKTAAINRSAMSAYVWLISRSTSKARRCVGNGNHISQRTRTVFSVCQSLSQALELNFGLEPKAYRLQGDCSAY